ncbi:endoplasmic reticulum-based factor for assembly of V-ATPase-domain-containing protein [Amylocarpus encephaloides]|uniref:Endoplasmic reticulum-based factor for assembly of V-ATPase-domain-containing protein n=1 Tax=Amylocarpus encephaloides TaxID=45428 RepID=A0A9P7YEU6_9HELO|nr:endoplasmic reticulum-based factor for assembly of V-ATPase-domain-containing protein [Amylocarpus encephaloides]
MVLLTMTAAMVETLESFQTQEANTLLHLDCDAHKNAQSTASTCSVVLPDTNLPTKMEPSLGEPSLGKPISHGQVVDLARQLKPSGSSPYTLEDLLKGSRIYMPPPAPKAESSSEYKALMARLRREEELCAYERMTNPPPPMETFAQRFPSSSAAHAFSSDHQSPEDDEVTYADIDRQMALIFNVLISIVACAGAIWVVARWWSTPARLAISMAGSMLVGVAEVVVYSGYIRRVGEAKTKAKDLKEVKEIVRTWVVGGPDEGKETKEPSLSISKIDPEDNNTRRRKPAMLQ